MALSLEDVIFKKRDNPGLLLVISVEGNRNIGESFWNSPKVKEILKNNEETMLSYRIIIDEIPSDYCNFISLYAVEDIPSLYIFEPNEAEGSISQKWVGTLPTPEQFELYILEGVVEEPIVHDPNEKMARIVVTTPQRKFSESFYRSDPVCVLYNWLNSEFGPHHSYTLASTNEPLTKDVLLTFKEAGLYPEAELIMHDENYGSMTMKETIFGHSIKGSNVEMSTTNKGSNKFNSLIRKIRNILSFIIPCVDDLDDESDDCWEYKPASNPDIAAVIASNVSQGIL